MPSRIVLLLALLVVAIGACAQQPETDPTQMSPQTFQEIVQKQFGPGFKLDVKFVPFIADFDGDKLEDLAIVVTGKDPIGNSAKFEYKVTDPYDSFWGFGDVKITTRFSSFGDGTAHCVLIIHDWRGEKPKAKFLVVNFPFQKLSIGNNSYKKRSTTGIYGHDQGGTSGVLFWDGKKYRWEPTEFDETEDMKSQVK
jgi:hypothetical protein